MRFKIESERVLNVLKARGFKICDLKKHRGKPVIVVEAPPKWNSEKTRYIVERVMREPNLGLPKPKVEVTESKPGEPKTVAVRFDPLPEIWAAVENAAPIVPERPKENARSLSSHYDLRMKPVVEGGLAGSSWMQDGRIFHLPDSWVGRGLR